MVHSITTMTTGTTRVLVPRTPDRKYRNPNTDNGPTMTAKEKAPPQLSRPGTAHAHKRPQSRTHSSVPTLTRLALPASTLRTTAPSPQSSSGGGSSCDSCAHMQTQAHTGTHKEQTSHTSMGGNGAVGCVVLKQRLKKSWELRTSTGRAGSTCSSRRHQS